MTKILKRATTLLLSVSSVGFSVVLYLCVVNHPILAVMVVDAINLDVYLSFMVICFLAVFVAGITHTLYLREKLYESQW